MCIYVYYVYMYINAWPAPIRRRKRQEEKKNNGLIMMTMKMILNSICLKPAPPDKTLINVNIC